MLKSRLTMSYFNPKTWYRACLFMFSLVFIVGGIAGIACSAQITLEWSSNTEPDLAGYNIHYGLQSGNYTYVCEVGNLTTCSISDLQPGQTYYFAATAYNSSGLESDFSSEISYFIPEPVIDSDLDGISDSDELNIYGTDPNSQDSDGDGISDGQELTLWADLWNADNDGDGIINLLDPEPEAAPEPVTAQVTLAWDPNSEPDLAGYKIHYGLQSGNYTFTCDAGNATSCTIGDLQPGTTYYFAATAYSTDGLESAFSAEIAYVVPASASEIDSDLDGISDSDELNIYGTDPNSQDSDGDGISDGRELTLWADLWNADNDGDGIINLLDPEPEAAPEPVTAQVTLAWDPNSEPDLAGYKIHYGLQSGNYTFTCDAGNATSCTIGDLQPGTTYYFAATAYSTAGLESAFSAEVAYVTP